MIPNKLTLRETNSPYGDLNKNSVLSRKQLDNNFVYLKGETIYSGETVNNNIILHKYNGEDIIVPISGSGNTFDQDNKFRFVDLGNNMIGGRGLDVDTDTGFINALNYRLDNTDLTVEDDELIIFKISVTIYGAFNTEERKYYFKGGIGKGVYEPLSTIMVAEDLELAYKDVIINDVDNLTTSPNVNLINLGTLPSADYIDYINTSVTTFNLTDSTKIHYFRFDYNGVDYIYVFDPNGSTYGYSFYGLGFDQFAIDDLVLFYDSSSPVVVDTDTVFSGTYSELNGLATTNQLVIGKNYILNDYVTKYQIIGSNSETRQEVHEMIGASGAYTQFNNVPSTIASNGDTITCVYAPPGALIASGQTFTIVDYFNFAYIRLSPTVSNPLNFGAKFRFEKQRYSNIPNNITILDTYGKPVIKPNGVINTEVHDDTPYMAMSGIENPTPVVEEIILKAIDTDKFSRDAESLTFVGDKLNYDFNDNIIYNENEVQIGTRNGFILRRTDLTNTISMNKDWRVQRYRRYKIDSINWDGMRTIKTTSGNPATSGSTIYQISGTNYCTTTNPTISEDHKYVVREPYISNFYTDFAKTLTNPFLTGTTSVESLLIGQRFYQDVDSSTYSNDVSLPLSGFSGTTSGKDFHIIPITSYEPSSLVGIANIKTLNNTVFLPYSQRYGNTANLTVDSETGGIYNSTFSTLPNIVNKGTLDRVTSIDLFSTKNLGGEIRNSIFLGFMFLKNSGVIANSTFGVGYVGTSVNEFFNIEVNDDSAIINSILGCNRTDKLMFKDFNANKCLLINRTTALSSFSGKWFLTMYKNFGSVYGSETRLNTFSDQKPTKGVWGHVYDFNASYNDRQVTNFNLNKSLIYESMDGSFVRTINVITTAS